MNIRYSLIFTLHALILTYCSNCKDQKYHTSQESLQEESFFSKFDDDINEFVPVLPEEQSEEADSDDVVNN